MNSEQEQFARSLHDLLAGADVPDAARQWAAGDRAGGLALWRKLAGAGVTALAVPERWGGLGASPLDIVVACEELGHHALPGPVAESVAVVPWLLTALADGAPGSGLPGGTSAPGASAGAAAGAELAARWLPALAAGDLLATVAMPPWLPHAVDADATGLVLLAGVDTVWLAEPGLRHRSVDRARSLFEVAGQQVLADGPAAANAVARAREAGTLANAAQLLGAGRALLEAGVRYARQRTQFGQPIGRFQAVKHRLADVAIGLEFARPLLDAAAAALAAGGADQPGGTGLAGGAVPAAVSAAVSAAKVTCTEAAVLAARAALQVHGAIGYTEEHDLHLWLTKVRALAGAWGSQSEHRARVMAALTTTGT